MWLVLCDAHDASAHWASGRLRQRGLQPVRLVTADQLALGEVAEHRIEGRHTTLRMRTEDGLQIDDRQLGGVLNRLYTVPVAHWRKASKADQDYVLQEMLAFHLSWLHGLACPVVNRPTPQGLCGQWRQESEWAWLAIRAGLLAAPYRQTSRDRIDESRGERRLVPAGATLQQVLVLGERVLGTPLPSALADACVRLARLADTHLLGIDLVAGTDGTWLFAGANPTPDLRIGGEPLIEGLMQDLKARKVAA